MDINNYKDSYKEFTKQYLKEIYKNLYWYQRLNYDKCPYCYAQEVLNNK